LGSASVDRWFTGETKGVCKDHAAILVCCRTGRLASSCDWWWVLIFLQYITTSHVDAIEKWCDHKTETWYSEQRIHVYNHMESQRLLCCRQTPKSYQNEQSLFHDKSICSARTNSLFSRKSAACKTIQGSSRQLLCSHKSGFTRLVWRTQYSPHAIPIVFTWSGP
jgi:hypothetical protein